jgi:hypothetical protein
MSNIKMENDKSKSKYDPPTDMNHTTATAGQVVKSCGFLSLYSGTK